MLKKKIGGDNFWGWLTLISIPLIILMFVLILPVAMVVFVILAVAVYIIMTPFIIMDKIKAYRRNKNFNKGD